MMELRTKRSKRLVLGVQLITDRLQEFVGDETIAGVSADHYTAEVAGLGAITGGVASDSRVDYWLAKDGGALIGYEATVETSTGPAGDPSTEVVSLDIHPTSCPNPSANIRTPVDATVCGSLRGWLDDPQQRVSKSRYA